jgi:phage terminase large subunit GpA-like protein
LRATDEFEHVAAMEGMSSAESSPEPSRAKGDERATAAADRRRFA